MNQIATTERSTVGAIALSSGPNGSSIAPQSLSDVVRFAEVMCKADIALPKHLRGNAGACMAVALQALEWQMSPFAVASKSYAVNGAIAYEAQLIMAVINTRSGIEGRLKFRFEGEGPDRVCIAFGKLDGEELDVRSPKFKDITPKNSPLWKSDPDQQHCYYTARSWGRRHTPEVILGVYDRDEAQSFQGADNAKDVTPSLQDRLAAAKPTPENGEGFDRSVVSSETAALTSGTAIDQEPSDASLPSGAVDAPVVDQGAEASPPFDSAPALSGDEPETKGDEAPAKAVHGEQSASSPDLNQEERDWLRQATKMLWAATGKGEQDVLAQQKKAVLAMGIPEAVRQDARDRLNSIFNKCKLVCFGERDTGEVLLEIAMSAGCEPKEIV